MQVMISSNLESVLALISLIILNSVCVSPCLSVSLPSWVLIMHLLIHIVMSHTPLRLCSFFPHDFVSMLLQTQWFHLLHLYICWFLSFLSLLTWFWSPAKLFNCCTLQLQYFHSVAFHNFYLFSNILHLFFIILLEFSSFLSTFKTTDFKYLSSKLNIWALPGAQFLLISFFCEWDIFFLPLHCSPFFVVYLKTGHF